MSAYDVLVIGGGISGATLAASAARDGRRVLLCEREDEVGGCLRTTRTSTGYWYELGAHTCYNSYGALLDALEPTGLIGELQPRGKPALRFHDGARVLPGKNLGLLLRRFDKLELLRALPRWFGADPSGRTVREHYTTLVGAGNFERVLGPMLAAVPSQRADEFPADMLFKKRPRRADLPRSFTLPNGLSTAVERLLETPGIEVRKGCRVARLERASGANRDGGFVATLDGGARIEAECVALAVPPSACTALLQGVLPEAAAGVSALGEVRIDSLGFAVRGSKLALPYVTFLIPLDDVFHSIVTRDVLPDPTWRGFAMHFRPGLDHAGRLAHAARILGVRTADLEHVSERTAVLPSPVSGHAERVEELDRRLAGERIAVCGNWFTGLSIEDCAERARGEWERVAALSRP